MLGDSITPTERLRPPSFLANWLEERWLRRQVRTARRELAFKEHLKECAINDIPMHRAHIRDLLVRQRARGFRPIPDDTPAAPGLPLALFWGLVVAVVAVVVLGVGNWLAVS